ncbi:unnamed protein product, partial [Bubo scandiacus]
HYQQQITSIDNSLANKMKDNAADICMKLCLSRRAIHHQSPAAQSKGGEDEACELLPCTSTMRDWYKPQG